MGCLGARGVNGKPAVPAFGDIGMVLITLLGARGMGAFAGLSPGLGLMGRPGLINAALLGGIIGPYATAR